MKLKQIFVPTKSELIFAGLGMAALLVALAYAILFQVITEDSTALRNDTEDQINGLTSVLAWFVLVWIVGSRMKTERNFLLAIFTAIITFSYTLLAYSILLFIRGYDDRTLVFIIEIVISVLIAIVPAHITAYRFSKGKLLTKRKLLKAFVWFIVVVMLIISAVELRPVRKSKSSCTTFAGELQCVSI